LKRRLMHSFLVETMKREEYKDTTLKKELDFINKDIDQTLQSNRLTNMVAKQQNKLQTLFELWIISD